MMIINSCRGTSSSLFLPTATRRSSVRRVRRIPRRWAPGDSTDSSPRPRSSAHGDGRPEEPVAVEHGKPRLGKASDFGHLHGIISMEAP